MKAVRCRDGHVHVDEVDAPAGDGVRVRIASAGICGSDLHLVNGPFKVDVILGHELAGFTEDGTPVAIEPVVPCGECEFCANGDYNLCRAGMAMCIGSGRDGGMAEEIVVPPRCLVPLASGMPTADACLIEPLGIAVHGLRRAGVHAGQKVAIVGGGSIGQCTVAAAVHAGAKAMLVARHDHQCVVGERLGAAINGEGEYDLVVDCAGTSSALNRCLQLARPGGALLMLGTYWEGLELDPFMLSMKEISVIPSSMYSQHGVIRDIDTASSLLANCPEIADAIITHRYPLGAAEEAFATAAHRDRGAIKVVLQP